MAWRTYVHGRLSKRAARILCESDFVRQDIERFLSVPADKIAVIPAPPLWEKTADINATGLATIRARYALPEKFLFYPAQFWAHKNHARLLEAFAAIRAQFPVVHLVLTGHPRFEYAQVMQRVKSLGLDASVHHIGYIQGDDLPAVYKLATALVMPSFFESISIPVYEAFRAGTPVCASGVLGLAEQIGDAGVMFDPHSTASMADAMRILLSDESLRRVMVERGRAILATMTLERYATQLDGVLAGVLASRRAA